MRNTICIVAFLLACSSVLATNTALFSKLDRISGSTFGKTILETVQVELQTSADPRPKIIQLLNELLQETQAAQEAADGEHIKQQNYYSQTLEELERNIQTLSDTIKTDSAEKNDKENELLTAESSLKSHEDAKLGFEGELTSATSAREANQRLFEEKDQKFRKIIDVLSQVRTWIQTRRDTRYEFLQKRENIFSNLVQLKSEDFLKVTPGYGKLIGFLATKVEKALQPTSEDAIAEGGLDSILKVIDSLIGHFQEQVTLNFNWNEEDKSAFETTKTRLETSIGIETTQITALTLQVSGLKKRIGELESAITINTELLETKKTEKTTTEQSRDEENEQYRIATENRKQQKDILLEVLDIVQNDLTGLNEYTENRIVNSDIKVDF